MKHKQIHFKDSFKILIGNKHSLPATDTLGDDPQSDEEDNTPIVWFSFKVQF